jgi:hypothetical protein
MTRTLPAPTACRQPPSAVILFGFGDDSRPRAAHFPAGQAERALRAASAMGLCVLKVAGPDQAKIAAKLPAGRIYANGRGLVPFVRKDLFVKLTEAARNLTNGAHISAAAPVQAAGAGPASGEPTNQGSATGQPPSAPASPPARSRRPKGFDDIKPGDLVLAHESPKDGWWEAIVTEVKGDVVTIKWRDYLRWAPEDMHRFRIALTCPDAP